ncbi:MAG: 2-oxoacid:acceptor oxidoreductase family protein [Halanaerobiaceae bacterium]
MYEEIVIAGFGGQGVMSLGKVIAHAGMKAGKEISWIPSYGPEMRGGTANCTVIISDKRIPSPFSSEPDTAIIMNLPSMNKFIGQVKSGGKALINSSLIDEEIARKDIKLIRVPAGKIASRLGNDRVANMVMLGAYLNTIELLSPDDIEKSLKKILPERRHNLLAINKKALKEGLKL